jgi:hypothetical protein
LLCLTIPTVYSDIWNEEDLYKELNFAADEKVYSVINSLLSGDITVLNSIELTKIFFEDLYRKLIILYEKYSGNEIPKSEMKKIAGLRSDLQISVIKNALEELNRVYAYPYLDPSVIKFHLINIVNNSKVEKPLRRRVPV